MTIDPDLISVLACPACKASVEYVDGKIVCSGCGRKYPVKNGIPVMLVEEAEKE